jgi:hypothetical protein
MGVIVVLLAFLLLLLAEERWGQHFDHLYFPPKTDVSFLPPFRLRLHLSDSIALYPFFTFLTFYIFLLIHIFPSSDSGRYPTSEDVCFDIHVQSWNILARLNI